MKLRASIALVLGLAVLLCLASNAFALSGTVGDFSATAKTKKYSTGSGRGLLVTTVTLKGVGLLEGRPQIKCGKRGCRRLSGKRYKRTKFYRTTVRFRNANLVVRRGKTMTVRLVSNNKDLAGRYITLSLKRKGKLRLRQTAYGCIDGGGRVIACPKAASPSRETHPPLYLFGDQSCENSAPAPWAAVPDGSAAITALTTPGVAVAGSGFCSVAPLVGGASVARDTAVTVKAGQSFTFSTWVRSSDGQPFCGHLQLWGLGAPSDTNRGSVFCVGSQWTPVSTRFVAAKNYSQLRSQIYFDSHTSDLLFDAPALTTVLGNSSFEDGSPSPWSDFANPGVTLATFAVPGIATDGASFLSAKAITPAHSFAQDVAANPRPGQSFTASIWLRSATGAPAKARLALFGIAGSTAESGSANFTVDGTWRKYSATLLPKVAAHSLRFEVYLDTANTEVFADDAQLYLN